MKRQHKATTYLEESGNCPRRIVLWESGDDKGTNAILISAEGAFGDLEVLEEDATVRIEVEL